MLYVNKIGYEESIIFKLLLLAGDEHCIHSCFSREMLRGCFYIECIMTQTLIDLLWCISGVTRTVNDIKRVAVPYEDWVPLLKMTNPNIDIHAGDWVRIKKGLYKNDPALVHMVKSWGVQVLLAPHLAYHPVDKKGKCKVTSLRPMPKLLDAAEYECTTLSTISQHRDGTSSIGRLQFEHGLISKSYDIHSIDPHIHDMPSSFFNIFRSAKHPFLSDVQMLRPTEWSFMEHERVLVKSTSKSGTIISMQGSYVDIDIDSEGVHCILWFDLCKLISTGDFIHVNSGANTGQNGWVTDVEDRTATILLHDSNNKSGNINKVCIYVCYT